MEPTVSNSNGQHQTIEQNEPIEVDASMAFVEPPRWRQALPWLLFAATCASTYWIGQFLGRPAWQAGLIYGGAVMGILLAHEMGHFLQALRYGVPATPPIFIPMPFSPFGTFGAVIAQGDHPPNRKALFDIAVSGPLAGLVLALPALYFGIEQATSTVAVPSPHQIVYGDPLIVRWMWTWLHGPLPAGHEILLTPLLFAAWVGIFVTALNLIPVGQLDGGHILYAILGKRAWPISLAVLWGAVAAIVISRNYSYVLIVVLLFLMGPKHPPTYDDREPLGWPRVVIGWLTLAFIVVGFTPEPIQIEEPSSEPEQTADWAE